MFFEEVLKNLQNSNKSYFENKSFWSNFFTQVEFKRVAQNENIKGIINATCDFKISGLNIDSRNVFIDSSVKNLLDENNLFNPLDLMVMIINYKIKNSLTQFDFEDKDFKLAHDIIGEKFLIKSIQKQYSQMNANIFIVLKDSPFFNNFCIENDLFKGVLLTLNTKENVDYFLSNKKYYNLFLEFLEVEKDFVKKLMESSIITANFFKIKLLKEFGVDFPNDKGLMGGLFLKRQKIFNDAQKYVINNIDDIAFGDQVILKTLLHAKYRHEIETLSEDRLSLVMDVVRRYEDFDNGLELFKEAIKKRPDSHEVLLIKKIIKAYEFEELLGDKLEEKRKLKI